MQRIKRVAEIKRALKISGLVVVIIMAIMLLSSFLLQMGRVQQAICGAVLDELSQQAQTKMSIGRVDYRLFNTLSLRDVYIEDLQGDTLLYINQLDARFRFFRFFTGRVIFHSLEFGGLCANLKLGDDGVANYRFLIDAFLDPEREYVFPDLQFQVERFRLDSSEVRFSRCGQAALPSVPSGKWDADCLRFKNLRAEIELHVLDRDTLSARVVNFCGEEFGSGFRVDKLTAQIEASPRQANLPFVQVSLPASRVNLSEVMLSYDGIRVADGNFMENVFVRGSLSPSYIRLCDLGAFVPPMREMEAVTNVQADVEGHLSNLRAKNVKVQYGETFVLRGNLDLSGLPDLHQTFIRADLDELRLNGNDTERFLTELAGKPMPVPEQLKDLGTVRYAGSVSGLLSDLVIKGRIESSVGELSTDVSLQFENNFRDVNYDGTLRSDRLDVGRVLQIDKVGEAAFYFNTSGSKKGQGALRGKIEANIPFLSILDYDYRGIGINGHYDGNGFDGQLCVHDENINLDFNGSIDLTRNLPVFNFALSVKETDLHALHLQEKYPDAIVSFNGRVDMTGSSLDNMNGFAVFDSIVIKNDGRELAVDEIRFNSQTGENFTNFSVASKYLNGSISGNFTYTSLMQNAKETMAKYVPALKVPTTQRAFKNHVDIDLAISNAGEFATLFDWPYRLNEISTIKGSIDEADELVDIVFSMPDITAGARTFQNTTVHFWGESEQLEFIVESNMPTTTDYWNLALYTSLNKGDLSCNVEWRNRRKISNRGSLRTLTRFMRDDNGLLARTLILPSEIIISDSLWNISADSLRFRKDAVLIDNFLFGNNNQYLNIDGVASKDEQDSLKVEMKDINLGFLSSLSGMKGFHVGGTTTGNALIRGALERPVFDAMLSIRDLALNHTLVGDASIYSTWDQANEQVVAIASVNQENNIVALGECTYMPSENHLDASLNAYRLSLDFLSGYYDKVLTGTTGYASGQLHIGGSPDSIRFDGRLMVNDGTVTVGVLGATYHFEDTIALTPQAIVFDNVTLYDEDENKVNLNGRLTHDGTFKNLNYNLRLNTSNAMVVDLTAGENDLAFGKAYVNGSVHVTGNEEEVNVRVNARTQPGTKIFFYTDGQFSTTDATGFIHFVNHEEEDEFLPPLSKVTETPSKTNLRLNLQLEVTPSAELGLIVNQMDGDMILGNGSGNLRIEYDDFLSDIKIYGSYTIESGKYLFTLQDVFRKEFRIESGSTVQWLGDLFDAQVNIKAIYALTASLKSLLDDDVIATTFSGSTRMTIPVNCILLLTGNLSSPNIDFEIDLPSSDEGVKQVVNSVISTEEMLARQVLYLLVFNQFYKSQEQNSGLEGSEFISLAASTVSTQLNNILSQLTTSNNFSLGVDMRWVDETNMEYQVDLSYRPNERWSVSGNFGYRENRNEIADYNQYITDVDIEYLITKSGKYRLKFYNRTIDRMAQLRTAKNTQGAGVVYKEDFDSLFDLFRYYWRALKNIGKKKNKKNEDNDAQD